jgi:hypothetical protein
MFTTNNSPTGFFNSPRIAVFNGTNYDEWALSVEMALGTKACWDIVSGTIVCPAVPAAGSSREKYESWQVSNSTAYFIIRGSMAARYQKLYRMQQPDTKQLWNKLASDHQDKVSKDVHGLRTKLLVVTLEDSGKVEYYAYTIQSIIDKYNTCASEESQLCVSCGGGSTSTNNFVNLTLDDDDDDDDNADMWPISRHQHVFALLHGLPDTPDWHLCVKRIKQQSPSILGRPAKVIESLQDTENELLERKG